MKLNKESIKKFRKELEERLKEIPEGVRIKIDKEKLDLEELLFENGISEYTDDEGKELYAKHIVWSGDFLSKLDLSEVSFEDVAWDLELYPKDLKELYYRKNGKTEINLSNTNANIDFSKSFEVKNIKFTSSEQVKRVI